MSEAAACDALAKDYKNIDGRLAEMLSQHLEPIHWYQRPAGEGSLLVIAGLLGYVLADRSSGAESGSVISGVLGVAIGAGVSLWFLKPKLPPLPQGKPIPGPMPSPSPSPGAYGKT